MAQHKSAKKRIRQTKTKTEINRSRVSRIRTFVKKVEAAIARGKVTDAKAAQPEIMRGVSKGVLTAAAASRKISRLSQRVKALQAKE